MPTLEAARGEELLTVMCPASVKSLKLPTPDSWVSMQLDDGTARHEGDLGVLQQLGATMVDFDPRFEILPGTKRQGAEMAGANPYQAAPGAPIAE